MAGEPGTVTPFSQVNTLPSGFTAWMKWTPQGWLNPSLPTPGTPEAEQMALAKQSVLPDLGYMSISNPFNVVSDIEQGKFISELGPPTTIQGAGITTPGISSQDASNIWQSTPMVDTANLSNQNVPNNSLHPGFIDTLSAQNGYNTSPPGTVGEGWPTLDGQPDPTIQNIWGDATVTQTSSDPNSPNYWGNQYVAGPTDLTQPAPVTPVTSSPLGPAAENPNNAGLTDTPVPVIPVESGGELPAAALPMLVDNPDDKTWTGPSGTKYNTDGSPILPNPEDHPMLTFNPNALQPFDSSKFEREGYPPSQNVIEQQDQIGDPIASTIGNLLTGQTEGLQALGDQAAILWRRMTSSNEIPSVQDFDVYEAAQKIAASPNWIPNPVQQALGNIPMPSLAGDNGPAPVEPPGSIAAGWPTLDGNPVPTIPVTSAPLPMATENPNNAGLTDVPFPVVPVIAGDLPDALPLPGQVGPEPGTVVPLQVTDYLNPEFPQIVQGPDTLPPIPLPPERPGNLAPDPNFLPGAPINAANSVAFPNSLAQRYIHTQTPGILGGGPDPTLAKDMEAWGTAQRPGSWVTFPNNPFTGQPTPPIQVPPYGATFTALDGTKYQMPNAPTTDYQPPTMFTPTYANPDTLEPSTASDPNAVPVNPTPVTPDQITENTANMNTVVPLPPERPFPGEPFSEPDANNPMNISQNDPAAVNAMNQASTMATDAGIPASMVATARSLVGTGADRATLQAFMARNGYPMNGAWCGEFMASLVSSYGITPPNGAAVASDWRNFGIPVTGAPQVGDIAVLNGVATGNTGSHVTMVGAISPDGTRFERVGGNQGGPTSVINWRPTSGYTFRRIHIGQ